MTDRQSDPTSPLEFHGGLHSADLDEIAGAAASTQHPLTLELPGRRAPIAFHLHHHPLSGIALTRVSCRHGGLLRVRTPPLERHHYLQIPLQGSGEVRCGTRTVRPEPGRCALLLSPGCATAMQNRGGFEEITLEIAAEVVDRTWETLTGQRPDRPIVFEPSLRLDAEPGACIRRFIRFLVDEVARPASPLATSSVQIRLEEALILCLLQSQPHSHDRLLRRRPPTVTSLLVRNAEAWMEARAAEPITMTAVAGAHGVALRSLQRAFERHRSYSPREFLRRVRLGHARRRLRSGDALTVTRVAMDLGFRHLGRFSVDYRSRYGESPSATLRRAWRGARPPGAGPLPLPPEAATPAVNGRDVLDPGRCAFCRGEVCVS